MKSEDQNYGCNHCVKSFSSQKALHGHMRLHSDRTWRGMQPPTLAPVNSSPPLSCWIKTAKRGRTAISRTGASSSASSSTSTVGSDQLAVNDMLVQHHSKIKKMENDHLNHKNQAQLKNENCPNKLYRCNRCDKEFTSHQALGGHKSRHNKTTTVSGLTEQQPSQKRKVLNIDLNELPPMDKEGE